MGGSFFLARGKRSDSPPEHAVGFKKSTYAVTLPTGTESFRDGNVHSGNDAPCNEQLPSAYTANVCTPGREQQSSPMLESTETLMQRPNMRDELEARTTQKPLAGDVVPAVNADTEEQPVTMVEVEAEQCDVDMQSAPSDEDVDMTRQMETGFKRVERDKLSFADGNPFDALEVMECDFETFEPTTSSETMSGMLIIPRLTPSGTAPEPLPTKRRSTNVEKAASGKLMADDNVVISAEKTELESHEDRVSLNMQHLQSVKNLLNGSKNMDKITVSMKTMPTAWSTALCCDLANGGKSTSELAAIHMLNRILATNVEEETPLSFNKRVVASKLPLGKTRATYTHFLTTEMENQTTGVTNQWEILRLLSAFELMIMATCPFVIGSDEWIAFLVGASDMDILSGKTRLLSNEKLLALLRSRLGTQVLTKLSAKLPTSKLIADIDALRNSGLSPQELPIITPKSFSPNVEAIPRS